MITDPDRKKAYHDTRLFLAKDRPKGLPTVSPLYSAIKRCGKTQKQIGIEIGLAQSLISEYINGYRVVPPAHQVKFATYFNTTVFELFGEGRCHYPQDELPA